MSTHKVDNCFFLRVFFFSFFFPPLFIAFEEIQSKTWDASKKDVYLDELCLMARAFPY